MPIQVKVGSSKSKVAKAELKPVPSIFHSSEYDSDNENGDGGDNEENGGKGENETVTKDVGKDKKKEKGKNKEEASDSKKDKRDSRGRKIYEGSLGKFAFPARTCGRIVLY